MKLSWVRESETGEDPKILSEAFYADAARRVTSFDASLRTQFSSI